MKIIDINGSERECVNVALDPDYPGFMKAQFRRHHEWYTIEEFIHFNPKLTKLASTAHPVAQEIVGTVTKAGSDHLQDSRQTWSIDTYQGFFVWISRGWGEGQKRLVKRNTANTLYIDHDWDVKPNSTSQYVLSYHVQDVKAFGNTTAVEDMKKFEKKAEELRTKRGLKMAPRQYNKKVAH